MENKKETPQQRWDRKNGYTAKSFKMRKELADQFKDACEAAGVSQSGQIVKMMQDFIEKNTKKKSQS